MTSLGSLKVQAPINRRAVALVGPTFAIRNAYFSHVRSAPSECDVSPCGIKVLLYLCFDLTLNVC